MLPRFTIFVLKYFDLFGYFTEYEVILNEKPSKNHVFIILSIHTILFSSICIISWNQFHLVANIFGVNDFIQLTLAATIYCSVIIESMCKRKSQQKIWLMYKKISIIPAPVDHLLLKSLLYVILNVGAAIRTLDSCVRMSTLKQFPYCVSYIILHFMFKTRIFYYAFYLEIFSSELKSIIQMVCKRSKPLQKLKKIRQRYELFSLLIDCLNDLFGWAHFITIVYAFLAVVAEFNFYCWCLTNDIPIQWLSIHILDSFRKVFVSTAK